MDHFGFKVRAIDHIGFELGDLAATIRGLEARGITLDVDYGERPSIEPGL